MEKPCNAIGPTAEYPIIVFHDGDVGRERRHYHKGNIVLNDGDNEMLSLELCREVEIQVKQGLTEGFTSDACYPQWRLSTFRP